jgi:hypothetical protein
VSEAAAERKPTPEAWSAKEVLGHLIDSAVNNHPRFVNAQLTEDLVCPGYDQEAWVRTQRYQEREWAELVSLWRQYNLGLANVMAAVPSPARTKPRLPHNLHRIAWRLVPEHQPVTLEYLMSDYVDHLEHHLDQIRRALWGG